MTNTDESRRRSNPPVRVGGVPNPTHTPMFAGRRFALPEIRRFCALGAIAATAALVAGCIGKSIPPGDLAAQAEDFLARGEQKKAEALLTAQTSRHPDFARPAFLLGACARSRFEVERAAGIFRHVVRLEPESNAGLCAALVLQMDEQSRDTARCFDALRLLVDLNPDDPVLRWMLAVQCRAQDVRVEGIHHFGLLARQWNPGPVMLHQTYGNLLAATGSRDLARCQLKLAVAMERRHWSVDALACAMIDATRFDEAEALHLEAIRDAPDAVNLRRNLATGYLQAERYEDCIRTLEEADRLSPNDTEIQRRWAEALVRLDRPKEAQDMCAVILKKNPPDPWTRTTHLYVDWQLNMYKHGVPVIPPVNLPALAAAPKDPRLVARFNRHLVDAASAGDRAGVAALLAWGVDIAATNEHGCTALHHAAEYGRADIVRDLIKAGAKVDTRNLWRQTPLYLTTRSLNPRTLECAQILLDAGADPNTAGASSSALRYAVVSRRMDLAHLLLKSAGAADGALMPDGATPLAHSCALAETDAVDWFLRHCADPNARDREGLTPLLRAILAPVRAAPNAYAAGLVARLLEEGADPDSEDPGGATALDWAALVGDEDSVATLARGGAGRTVPKFPLRKAAADLPDGERFALACEAPMICASGGNLGIPGGQASTASAIQRLNTRWGCADSQALGVRLDTLWKSLPDPAPSAGGDGRTANPDARKDPAGWVLAAAARYYREVGIPGREGAKAPSDPRAPLLAWRTIEYLHLCALGRMAQWIPGPDASRRTLEAQARLSAAFDSWTDFASSAEAGQRLLDPQAIHRYRTIFARLADRGDPNNPWAGTPWPGR